MKGIADRFSRLRSVYADAERKAPALARRFAAAGVRPQDFKDEASLNRLPVLKKERLLELQAAEPPFGGFLACDIAELAHIYVSPGPIFEPSLASDDTGHGMDMMFRSAGVGPKDVALNTWAYHLVPAGLLFDKGLRAVGATVIPAGTGNSELQAELLTTLRPTVFLGSTAYFSTLVEQLRKSGRALPDAWALRHAFLGGEFGDWSAKRRAIESEFKLKTWSIYGTADFGLIGYEIEERPGYFIHDDRYVQICDPATGAPLAAGEAGEIVVTTLTPGWPMIRFGTGDLGRAVSIAADGGVDWLAPIEGRVGAARKIREIFVYPDHLKALATRVDGLAEVRLRIGREGHRETITLELLPSGANTLVKDAVADCFRMLTRLRADHLVTIGSADAFTHVQPIAEDADTRNV
jgi:phenylacetate-CoA ligase